jgi:peptidoglycan/LPS O-acetylase OafA/YrhL
LNPQPDSSTTGRHIPALDGVRGIAIVAVLICHLFWSNMRPEGGPMTQFIAQSRAAGWVGVELFFVLSGFLITGILYDTLQDTHFFRNFYARRVLRIFPLYYGVFALLLIITAIRGEYWTSALFGYLTYTQNLHLKGALLTNANWININHFWSLMVEEQFYFVWPLLVFLLRSIRRISIAAASIAIGSLVLRLILVHAGLEGASPYLLYAWTPCCLDAISLGALLSMAVRSRFHERVQTLALPVLIGCIAIILAIWFRCGDFVPDAGAPVTTWGTFFLSLGFAAFIAATLRAGSVFERTASNATLRFFGRYSYGLYVYHYTIAGLIVSRLRPWVNYHFSSKFLGVLFPGLAALATSVLVAWLSFKFYESRFLLLKKRFQDHSRRPKLHEVIIEAQRPPALH